MPHTIHGKAVEHRGETGNFFDYSKIGKDAAQWCGKEKGLGGSPIQEKTTEQPG